MLMSIGKMQNNVVIFTTFLTEFSCSNKYKKLNLQFGCNIHAFSWILGRLVGDHDSVFSAKRA